MRNGNKTNEDGDILIFTLNEPYTNVAAIKDVVVNVFGESEICYYDKDFRISQDGILYSDYKEITTSNLRRINIDPTKPLYIQYRFTQVDDGELQVNGVKINVEYGDGQSTTNPVCSVANTSDGDCCQTPTIAYNCGCNTNIFNPYAIGNANKIYQQLSTLVSNMFGFCVDYFKTEADAKTKDVILHEYSLEHVVDKKNIKMLIPDNQLPTRELRFSYQMIDYPTEFEVHIVKSEFWAAFGQGTRPAQHDYLYMSAYMNRMYEIDAVSEADDFGYNGTYWRVSLVPYQQRSAVKFDNNSLLEDTQELIFSADKKFETEVNNEFADIRKDNQLNDNADINSGDAFGFQSGDFIRKYLNPHLIIQDENIYNASTVISKQYYALPSIKMGEKAVEYRYSGGINSEDERMISLWFRPKQVTYSSPMLIENIEKTDDGKVKIKLEGRPSANIGDFAKVMRTTSYKGFYKISSLDKANNSIIIDTPYVSGDFCDGAKVILQSNTTIFQVESNGGVCLNLSYTYNQLVLNINGKNYFYYLGANKEFENGTWYAVMIGFHSGNSSAWIYKINEGEKAMLDNRLETYASCISSNIDKFGFTENITYGLVGSQVDITNIRLWNKLCEESLHNMLLSQYVVDDTHNCDLADNAQRELLVNNKYS